MNENNESNNTNNSKNLGLHKHKYEEIVVEPTCLESGYTLHKCIFCGYEYKDNFVPPVAHKYVSEKIRSTCTKKGYTLHTCVYCGHEYKDDYRDEEHTYVLEENVAAECEKEGKKVYKCKHCGKVRLETTPALNHNFGEWIEIKHPTCTEEGELARECVLCGKVERKKIPAKGHQFTAWKVEGDKSVRYCKNCGKNETITKKQQALKKVLKVLPEVLNYSLFFIGLLFMVVFSIIKFKTDYYFGPSGLLGMWFVFAVVGAVLLVIFSKKLKKSMTWVVVSVIGVCVLSSIVSLGFLKFGQERRCVFELFYVITCFALIFIFIKRHYCWERAVEVLAWALFIFSNILVYLSQIWWIALGFSLLALGISIYTLVLHCECYDINSAVALGVFELVGVFAASSFMMSQWDTSSWIIGVNNAIWLIYGIIHLSVAYNN